MSSKVRSALVQSLIDLSSQEFWNYPIVAENNPEIPNSSNPWLGISYLPNIPTVQTLGDGGEDDMSGIFQIDIFIPLGKGEKVAFDIADVLRSYFTAGRRFVYSGQEVVITGCGSTSGFNSNNFFRVPVSVIWYSRLTRTIN